MVLLYGGYVMSYASLEKKLKLIPEAYLDEVSDYIEFLLFKINAQEENDAKTDLSEFFGSVRIKEDGLDIL